MKKIAIIAAVLVVAGSAFWWIAAKRGEVESFPLQKEEKASASRIADVTPGAAAQEQSERSGKDSASPLSDVTAGECVADESNSEEPQTEEEKREAAEEKAVNDFDDLTDKWQEASEKGVTMADIDNFAKMFRGVPKDRQDECIHRALNLIPDENVMLLAGVLMDKSIDKDIVETVFNDVLNRDEDVKKPILRQIFKDKAHPCWADTAWILDVTDELPKAR